jgi:P4 family phage/plasmid primase-like protien
MSNELIVSPQDSASDDDDGDFSLWFLSHLDPYGNAKKFHKRRRHYMIRQNDVWYDYSHTAGHYVLVEDGTVSSDMQKFFAQGKMKIALVDGTESIVPFWPVLPKEVNEAVTCLERGRHRPFDTMKPPCWLALEMAENYRALDIIPMKNGLLHLPTRELLQHTPAFFCLTTLPIAYDANAPEPTRWLKFMDEITASKDGEARPHLVDSLQEAIGYTISLNRNHQKIFFGKGKRGGGKGTLARALEQLMGPTNCSHPTIMGLNGRFGLESSIDKTAIIITDATALPLKSMDGAAEALKTVSGQDARNVERKNKTDWHGTLPGQFWIWSNSFPNFGSSADALNRRLIVWPFDVSFEDNPDPDLTDRLIAELPGILNWALVGLDRLNERGNFVECPESVEAKKSLLRVASPLAGVVDDYCVLEPNAWVTTKLLYEFYCQRCAETRNNALSHEVFTRRLNDDHGVDRARRDRKHGPDGLKLVTKQQVPIYKGIRFNDETAVRVYRHDPELVGLFGEQSRHTILTDEDGFPVPAPVQEFDD